MDSLINSAARLLASGDPLGALKRIALRNDPPALALRGIAMAQLGDYQRSRQLLHRAARGLGPRQRLAQARCYVAEAEVALATRNLLWPPRALDTAARVLDTCGDHMNAVHARLLGVRRELLIGNMEVAEQKLSAMGSVYSDLPPPLAARAELTRAEIALRRVRVTEAMAALARAHAAARAAKIPALIAEIERVRLTLASPSARLIQAGVVRLLRLDEVAVLFASDTLIVDGCRRMIRGRARSVSLARRPVLFDLVSALAEAWPKDVSRGDLIVRAFKARVANESHRVRLRVELGRLRVSLRHLAGIEATPSGFTLRPIAPATAVLTPPIDGPSASILALLEGGESWSTSGLASALGSSQRTVQRALSQLEESGAVWMVGGGRSRRWLAPALGGFATTLLLPGALIVS